MLEVQLDENHQPYLGTCMIIISGYDGDGNDQSKVASAKHNLIVSHHHHHHPHAI